MNAPIVDDLLYFDCNARYGPRARKHPAERWTREHLLDDMDQAGIAAALVVHEQALLYDPMHGNLRLVKEIADVRRRLTPCWVALPPVSGEFPPPGDLLAMMDDHGVRAVRIAPTSFHVPLREDVWAPLRDRLATAAALVVVSAAEFANNWERIGAFCHLFAGCPVLLLDAYWTEFRDVLCAADAHRNLHVEFSSLQANRAIEHLAERIGPERCLFGTNLPYKSAGAARAAIDWSLLPRDEAGLVAGGNLSRLLAMDPTPVAPSPDRSDPLTAAARQGQPLPCLALDAHCHLLHDGAQTGGQNYVQLRGDASGMRELAAKIGIRRTAVMSWTATVCHDAKTGNEIVRSAVERFPDAYTGVVSINAELQSDQEILETIEKYHERLGFAGLEPFTRFQLIDFDHPAYAPWFAYADRNKLYVLLDWGPQAPTAAANAVLSRYANAAFIASHAGRSFPHADGVIDLMKTHEHLRAELDFTSVPNGLVEYFVDRVGAERVLFGTDAPMRDPRPQAGWIVFSRLTAVQKRQILGDNFNAILRRAWEGRRQSALSP